MILYDSTYYKKREAIFLTLSYVIDLTLVCCLPLEFCVFKMSNMIALALGFGECVTPINELMFSLNAPSSDDSKNMAVCESEN